MSERKNFARLKNVVDIPYLLELQTDSYKNFVQMGIPKTKRKLQGSLSLDLARDNPMSGRGCAV